MGGSPQTLSSGISTSKLVCPRRLVHSQHSTHLLYYRTSTWGGLQITNISSKTGLVGHCFVDDSKIIQVDPSTDTPTDKTVKLVQKSLDIFTGADQEKGG